jgi:hypothetical protein
MTENPRSILLQRARRRTAAIVMGALAGTGLLTAGIAATAQQASGLHTGTPGDTTSGSTSGGQQASGSSGDSTGGVSSSTGSGSSDGGTHSS